MPWTCVTCGRQGERAGTAEPSWCTRAGMGSMKGELQCCNCMLNSGWDQYNEQACKPCMRLAKRRLPQDSSRRQEERKVGEAFTNLVVPKKRMEMEGLQGLKIPVGFKRISVFEFDEVLFKTPNKPQWWPFNSYPTMMNSLLPPTIPTEPSDEWWSASTVAKAKAACEDPQTWAVLITYRHDGFRGRLEALLAGQGIKFNELRLRPLRPFLHLLGRTQDGTAGYGPLVSNFTDIGPTKPQDMHLLVILGDMVQRAEEHVAQIDLWASGVRAECLQSVIRSTQGRKFEINAVNEEPMAPGNISDEELAAMRAVQAYVTQISKKGNVITARHEGKPVERKPRRSGFKLPSRFAPRAAAAPGKGKAGRFSRLTWPADIYLTASLSTSLRLYPMLLEEEEDDWDDWEEEDEEEEEAAAAAAEEAGYAGEGDEEGAAVGGAEAEEDVEVVGQAEIAEAASEYEGLASRVEFEWIESSEVAQLAAGFMEREWSGDLTGDVLSVASDDDVMSMSSAMTDDVISISSHLTEDLAARDTDVKELANDPALSAEGAGSAAASGPKGVWGGRETLGNVLKPPEARVVPANAPSAKPAAPAKKAAEGGGADEDEAFGDAGDKARRRGLKGGKFK